MHALLFTDVVDSTLLVERLGDARAAGVWAEHDRRARELLVRHRGREIDRTDGFFLLFDQAADAAGYALAYHQALADLDLVARAGLHVGAVTLRENAPADVARGAKPVEVEGLAKPLAARVMGLALGGQTLLSAATVKALGEPLPAGTQLESHGHYRLKGVEAPVEIFELGVLGAPFAPPPDADKAYRVVRAGDLWRPVREVRHNLPAERDTFVGRSEELRTLAARLDAGARLLTVLGSGGSGKTRLVRRYGWIWLGDWPGGIYFCDLSEARSLDGIFFAVASALEVPLGKGDPAVQLGHAVAGRGRCLILLDNFEQVLEHAHATLGSWLDRAADASFVVTSRERLHLLGEGLLPLEPLPLNKEAIELFAVRAKAQRPDFALTDANRTAVAEVVRLLDGLPLAIELAAARITILAPSQLLERLKDRFKLLAGTRGAAKRQATLKAAIDWSWDLLTPWEQAALAQCSVFEGGFTLEAAEAVLDLTAWPDAPPTLDAVQALVDKCLLRTWVPAEQGRFDIDEPYFGMYVSIHEYAKEKLNASGEQNLRQAEERHGRHFATFGTDDAIESLSRHGGVKRRRALALELDNLVTACRRAAARSDGEVAVATYRAAWEVLEMQGPLAVGIALGDLVLTIEGLADSHQVATLATHALAAWRCGLYQAAAAKLEQALPLTQAIGDRRREGSIRGTIASLHNEQGRLDQALSDQEAALALHREVNNRGAEAVALKTLGVICYEKGRIEQALAHCERSISIAREAGNRGAEANVLTNLGLMHRDRGRFDEGRRCFEKALVILQETGDYRSEGIALGNLGLLNCDEGRAEEALACYEAALANHRQIGYRRFEGIVLGNLGALKRAQGSIPEASELFEQALAIHRETGNRRHEGIVLTCLAELMVGEGRMQEGVNALREGEAVLRGLGDQLGLANLLCLLGWVEVKAGHVDAAQQALAEAEALAEAAGAGPSSECARNIKNLRDALL